MHFHTAKYVPAMLALIVGMVGLQGCNSVTNESHGVQYWQNLRTNWRAQMQANDYNRERKAEVIGPSVGLAYAELGHHLPPSAVAGDKSQRLFINRRGGTLFGAGTYEVVALADFTPERIATFSDAAQRLQGHLQPAPRFKIQLYRDTEGVPILAKVIELN